MRVYKRGYWEYVDHRRVFPFSTRLMPATTEELAHDSQLHSLKSQFDRSHLRGTTTRSLKTQSECRQMLVQYQKKRKLKSVEIIVSAWNELEKCEVCGKLGDPARITSRWDLRSVDPPEIRWGPHATGRKRLCMSCWNRFKAIARRSEYCDSVDQLLELLRKTKPIMPEEMPKIENIDDFRAGLCMAIRALYRGEITSETARATAKLAAQVNESLRVEIAATKLQLERDHKAPKMGRLPIGIKK